MSEQIGPVASAHDHLAVMREQARFLAALDELAAGSLSEVAASDRTADSNEIDSELEEWAALVLRSDGSSWQRMRIDACKAGINAISQYLEHHAELKGE